MVFRPTQIAQNAQTGCGPCEGCDAHTRTGGGFVNPGLSNPDADLLFVSEEPRHPVKWAEHDDWTDYNETWLPRFKAAQGGQCIEQLLEEVDDLTIDDVWITDTVKCPTKSDSERGIPVVNTEGSFAHCRTYLATEIDAMDPAGIVTLGRQATRRTLEVLGVPEFKARYVRVSRDFGLCEFETAPPVVISLHWAQRTVAEDEWIPPVQRAIAQLVNGDELG